MKKSFLAIVLTLTMFLSIPVSAESLSEFFSDFPIPSEMEMEVKANVQVKKVTSSAYAEGPINVKKKTSDKAWPEFDFQATMYMASVRSAFRKYTGISKVLIADDAQLSQEFNDLPVYGGFTISVTYPASLIIPETFLSAGDMEGFNEEAKSVFKEISRTETTEGKWKTLTIEIAVKSPDGTADYVKQKELADNLDTYLPDFTLTCEDVATSSYGSFPVYGAVEGYTNIGGNTEEEGRITVLSYTAVPEKASDALSATVRVVRDTFVDFTDDTVGGGVVYPTGGSSSDEVIVSFDVAGETVLVDAIISEGQTVVNLDTIQKPKRDGFIFDGWYSDPTYKTPISGTVTVTKDSAFFGRWISTEAPEILNAAEHVAYISGYEDGTVRPENAITREEIATILYRLIRVETPYIELKSYSDVAPDRWSTGAISAMNHFDIMKGYPDGTFQPSKAITRAEFATLINRLYGDELLLSGNGFYDAAGHWAEENIISAAHRGIVTGYEDGTFRPDANVTRAEAVTILNRLLVRHVDTVYVFAKVWPDNLATAWYYFEIIEASNTHNFSRREDGVYEDWVK